MQMVYRVIIFRIKTKSIKFSQFYIFFSLGLEIIFGLSLLNNTIDYAGVKKVI
jgi:hypothetical protein